MKNKTLFSQSQSNEPSNHDAKQIKLDRLTELFASIISTIGEDLHREGLVKTPRRAAKAFQYLMSGYDLNIEQVVNNALFKCDNNEMVIVKDIELFSLCEHHLLPFIGKCHIGYLPDGKVIGLSKMARIVDMYARRLQIQESLSNQIAQSLMNVTGASGVGVVIEAMHSCMIARGVRKQNATVKTCAMIGSFKNDPAIRKEFLTSLHLPGAYSFSPPSEDL